MIYFSEIQNHRIYTEDAVLVGKLKDFIFLASETPKITKMIIERPQKEDLIVPIEYLQKINGRAIIEKNYIVSKLENNELYLVKNLLDNQIIDIVGDKLVRVNDVVIQDKPHYHIAGVDIGVLGILRRLGIEDYVIKALSRVGIRLTSKFLSWADIHPLELTRGHVKIRKEQRKLERIRPEDLADYLEKTNILNVNKVLKVLDEKKAAEVIENLNITYQTALFKTFKIEKAAKIISLIDTDEAADVLLFLSRKKREQILDLIDSDKREQIQYLLQISKTPVGDMVTMEYLVVESNATVKEVAERIKRETGDFFTLPYIYVINKDKQLVGVFTPHELLLQNPDTQVYKFMIQNLIVVYLTTPEVVVFKKIVKYKLFALPVVDKERRIIGMITLYDIADLLVDKL